MITARMGAAVLFAVGVAVGTTSDAISLPQPPRVGDYVVLTADFHVHAFGGDGTLGPWSIRREAARRGLHAITITNHNQVYAARIARALSHLWPGPIVIIGDEITSRKYHLIAAGISSAVDWDQPAAAAIEAVHAQGGVAIAAHPVSDFWEGLDDRSLTLLDGVEAAHPLMQFDEQEKRDLLEFHQRARRVNPDVAAIGSSDFHSSPTLGACRTYLLAREISEAGVLDAVRSGRTIAQGTDGALFGDPALVAVVEDLRLPPPVPGEGVMAKVSVVCSWLGLLGLALFGRGK